MDYCLPGVIFLMNRLTRIIQVKKMVFNKSYTNGAIWFRALKNPASRGNRVEQVLRVYIYQNNPKVTVSPAITTETIVISLIRIFKEGPDVSLNGSPTVSPTTPAL